MGALVSCKEGWSPLRITHHRRTRIATASTATAATATTTTGGGAGGRRGRSTALYFDVGLRDTLHRQAGVNARDRGVKLTLESSSVGEGAQDLGGHVVCVFAFDKRALSFHFKDD